MIDVIHGDCVAVVPTIAKKYGGFDFAFLDPPFNIGQDYPEYRDTIPVDQFEQLILNSFEAASNALSPNGVVAIHGPDHVIDVLLDGGFPKYLGLKRIAWVNWYYAFGQHGKTNWVDSRCHCLIYAKGPTWTWNVEDVLRPSARATKYSDSRTLQTETPGMRTPGTVWGVPEDGPYWGRVPGNSRERIPEAPNQLPEVYIARLLRAYTDPGDMVLDCFGGSGTVPTVAASLRRSAVSIDISSTNVAIIRKRVAKGAVRTEKDGENEDG